MKHLLLSIGLCLCLAASACAQITTPKGSRSDTINLKIREVDLLLKLLPLILTKDQLNSKILPTIEKNRDILRKELAYEDDELAKLESDLDTALTNAYSKGAYPARTTSQEVADKTSRLGLQRQIIVGAMTDNMIDALNACLNTGQKKALLGSFDLKFMATELGVKVETLTDDTKMRFFVQNVFLDPIAYDILLKLAKTAQ